MREQLDQRLKQLKAEFEAGQKMLADLEAKQGTTRFLACPEREDAVRI